MTRDILFSPQPNFDRWLATARRASAGGYTRDAILGGLRARLFTNQLALAEAWSDTFFGPQDWQTLVGQTPPPQAVMSFYAVFTEKDEPVAAIDPAQSAGILVNRTEESLLLDVVATLAARKLGEQTGWVARGTCASAGQRSVLVTGPVRGGSGRRDRHPRPRANRRQRPSAGAPYAPTPGKRMQLAPTRIITERGQEMTSARIWQWLRHNAYQEPRADVYCLTLDGLHQPVMARDLDLDRCAEPYVYPLSARQSQTRPASAGYGCRRVVWRVAPGGSFRKYQNLCRAIGRRSTLDTAGCSARGGAGT